MEQQVVVREYEVSVTTKNKTYTIGKHCDLIHVVCENSKHKVNRSSFGGRYFDTYGQAISSYKSTEAKEAIKTAKEILK